MVSTIKLEGVFVLFKETLGEVNVIFPKYNVITRCQVNFQPTKLAKLSYVHLQLIMLIKRMTI
jgi:hypothetical protein